MHLMTAPGGRTMQTLRAHAILAPLNAYRQGTGEPQGPSGVFPGRRTERHAMKATDELIAGMAQGRA
jgi:hypothetical protein